MTIVVDCSAILGAWLDDESNALVVQLLAEAEARPIHAPSLLPLEFANALLMAERRKRMDAVARKQALEEFAEIAILIDANPARGNLQPLSELARLYNLTLYDAAYLELALRLQLPLATLDTRLAAAARASGVAVVPDAL